MPVIDADVLAREAVAKGTDGLREVVTAFGPAILGRDGELDRKALAAIVFSDEAARRKLNAIVHPLIGARTLVRASELAAAGQPLACYEAALIVENNLADAFRPLVVCVCSEEVQVARVRARGDSGEDAFARIRAQKPLAEKVAAADYVIDTSGTLEENRRQTDEVLRSICARLGVDFARFGEAAF